MSEMTYEDAMQFIRTHFPEGEHAMDNRGLSDAARVLAKRCEELEAVERQNLIDVRMIRRCLARGYDNKIFLSDADHALNTLETAIEAALAAQPKEQADD